eukprot:4984698-Amphidinium_carterae.2
MPIIFVIDDVCSQVIASPMHRPDQAARAATECLCMWSAETSRIQLHICQVIAQAASAVLVSYSDEQQSTYSGALLDMHSLDYLPLCSQCDVLVHALSSHFSCSVAILTQRTLLVFYTLSYAAGAAYFAQLPVDRGFLLLLLEAASAAAASLPQAASAAAGMAAAGLLNTSLQGFTSPVVAC